MTDTYQVQPRTVQGKSVRKLRREGVLPASIYGRGIESVAVQLPYIAARDMMNAHGFNMLVNVQIEGEAKARPVVVRKVDQDPVTRQLRHVDFYQVDLTRKISGAVPLTFIGEAPITHQGGVVMHQADAIEVEALPADLPESIEVTLDGLTDFDSRITIADIRPPQGVTILADPELLLVGVTRPRVASEEEAEIVEGEQPEAAAAGEPEAEAGEQPAAEAEPSA